MRTTRELVNVWLWCFTETRQMWRMKGIFFKAEFCGPKRFCNCGDRIFAPRSHKFTTSTLAWSEGRKMWKKGINSVEFDQKKSLKAEHLKVKKINFKKCPSSKPQSSDFGNVKFSISLKLCEHLCGILLLSQRNLSFWQKFHNLQFTVGALSKTWRRV